MPKWFGGITNSFSFKGIDFSFMLQYSYGNDVFNATRQFATGSQDQRYNMLAEVADRWSPTNASNKVPSTKGYVKGDVYSRFVEDGSFLRLKNMTLGYSLPKNGLTKSTYPNFAYMVLHRTCSASADIADMIRKSAQQPAIL